MSRRARLIHNDDGTVEASANKYNGKYLLGNLLVCGDCGVSYRRRTERGNVIWRCAARIEKGKEACSNSPTLDEEWVKNVLDEMACENGVYDENIIKDNVAKVQIFDKYIIIHCKNGKQVRCLRE